MIPWLERDDPFPAVERALSTPNGLLAASADLTADRLLDAYGRGIFPWYGADEPVLWWSPDPRMVLFTGEFKITRSLRKTIRKAVRCAAVEVRIDTAFDAVIRACAAPRPKQNGTWITPAVIGAYGELHRRGLAHSVEIWRGPPRQNRCRPHRTLNLGAMMEEQVGQIRTSIQGPCCGAVAAA